ncbi:MAG: hypothetical protein ACOYYS_18390, partial [Chloroflexota bacterium]
DMKWNGFQNGILHARYTFQFHYWVGPGIGRLALRVWTGDYFGCDSGKWMDRGDGLNDFLYFADDESFDINDRCVVDFDIILRDDSNATLALAVMHFNHSYAATYGAAYEGYWEVLGVEIPLPTPTPTPTPQPTGCPPGEICPAGGAHNP